MNYILMGIQGSGKATQSKILKEKLKLLHYDSGSTLRSIAGGYDDFALLIKEKINNGDLVDDHLVISMLDSFLLSVSLNQNVIIDGIPRTVHQAHLVQYLFDKYKRDFLVIYLDLPKNIAIERILKRFEIEKRNDDKKDIILKRINIFFEQTIPAVNYFRSINKLIEINANQSIENVNKEIFFKLNIK